MSPMEQFALQVALHLHLHPSKIRMTVEELAKRATKRGIRTLDGGIYKGHRGTYTLLETLYYKLPTHQAQAIAETFTLRDGRYAYEK